MDNNLTYLGTAFTYPFQPDEKAQIDKSSDVDAIKNSMYVILTTPLGTYWYIEDFGSNLQKLKFEQNDQVLESLLRFHVVEALTKWEKRAKILDVSFQDVNEAQKNIIITFEYKKRNEIDSYIYPFYKELVA